MCAPEAAATHGSSSCNPSIYRFTSWPTQNAHKVVLHGGSRGVEEQYSSEPNSGPSRPASSQPKQAFWVCSSCMGVARRWVDLMAPPLAIRVGPAHHLVSSVVLQWVGPQRDTYNISRPRCLQRSAAHLSSHNSSTTLVVGGYCQRSRRLKEFSIWWCWNSTSCNYQPEQQSESSATTLTQLKANKPKKKLLYTDR